ncbi:MAG: nicotinate-nucleotide--dimethylbenzimidazole phosphoribosyltransferase [Desulfobacteraceae bacterium]|nr:nicotinate-nucleotide--dimethylbenzimidazole phosphoribosyltransferase [Desulfobacteraceae bacterium]
MKMILTGLKSLEIDNTTKTEPGVMPGYANLKVLCCAICRTDAKMWEQGHRDLVLPRVLGHEMVVEDKKGNRFVVWPGKSCGTCKFCKSGRENLCEDMKIAGFHNDGGFADHIIVPNECLIPLADDIDCTVACFAEPVGCVINAFEKFSLKKNARVLIYGGGTMGLLTALFARHMGFIPLIIEKNEDKIGSNQAFLNTTGLTCVKETQESEYDAVINACPDFIAFCQGIVKVDKGGHISFFSGITKNEHIETNLINLLHYKEAKISGAYGMTRQNMSDAIGFIKAHAEFLKLLIQDIVPPEAAPDLMPKVLSGKYLKYILDFRMKTENDIKYTDLDIKEVIKSRPESQGIDYLKEGSLCKSTINNINPVENTLLPKALAKIDDKTKPLGALGIIEDLAVQMSLIQKSLSPEITQKNLFVFAADHGITEEGVSAYPSEVTGQMVENFLNGGAAINVLCRHHNIDMKVVDMGVKADFKPHPSLIRKKIRKGTRNFAIEDAMSKKEATQALEHGMEIFFRAHEKSPIDIVGLGEMGIGNTTSASAIISVITGITPAQATGRGTGVDDKGLEHKTEVIEKALAFHKLNPLNGFEILQKIGGYEIAGIAGAALAAASLRSAIVLDGVISTAAGLLAYLIKPDIKGYLISGHKSVEKAQMAALSHMDLAPLIDFHMRLGEGTGAAMAIDVACTASKIMTQMASFDEAKISRTHSNTQ